MAERKEAPDGVSGCIRRELQKLLDGGQAHVKFEEAVKDWPENLRGVRPDGLPYSAWQIVEHLRIAQHDILEFTRNYEGKYKELKWPEDYWPKEAEPSSAKAWKKTLEQIAEDRTAFEDIVDDADDAGFVQAFPWGDGQTLMRETFLIATHMSYHTGELVVLRRLLGIWKK